MPDLTLAEAILSLVTPPDQAACIAGDLAEISASDGRRGFWIPVLATAFALFWQPARMRPYRISVVVLTGLLLTQIALSGIVAGKLWQHAPWLGTLLNSILGPVLIGIAVARTSRGSEMTSCGLLAFATALLAVLSTRLGFLEHALALHFLQGNLIASFLFILCGVACRRQRPRPLHSA